MLYSADTIGCYGTNMRTGPIAVVVIVVAIAAVVVWYVQPRDGSADFPPPVRAEVAVEKPTVEKSADVVSAQRPDFEHAPDDLDAYLPAQIAAAKSGSADAAYELFRLTYLCTPPRFPRTEADVVRGVEELRSWTGQTVDLERELERLERRRNLCDYIARRALPDHLHWIGLAAERGHPDAMVGYWHFHAVDRALHPERYDAARSEAVRLNAIAYLERARDAGVADAFSTIGAGQAGLLGSTPFERDDVEGLAHLYAAGRIDPDEGARWAASGFIGKVELSVPAYALAEARDRAEELLRDCCK